MDGVDFSLWKTHKVKKDMIMGVALETLFGKPVIVGHRGFRAEYPENTLAGFSAAAEAGADMIELDVRLSADGHLMVIHDAQLDRTTDGKGFVKDQPFLQLKKLDAGFWFNPRFARERLPELEEVLDGVLARMAVNIEIKYDPEAPAMAFEAADQVVACIRKKQAEPFTLVSCFYGGVLRRVYQKAPDLHLGVLTYKNKKGFLNTCQELKAFSWNPDYRYLDPDELLAAKNEGLKVLPYTVNSRKDMKRLLDMGVDGFITDDPVEGRAAMKDINSQPPPWPSPVKGEG
ncbi:MAG: glycerophosphodiester phosphodiesterase [Desulfobacteraceae bacterium]|nr:glycerophosphodiester phosphodiesterase [Desulfobacteraceae bacterium]